jgi:hypothetical protein
MINIEFERIGVARRSGAVRGLDLKPAISAALNRTGDMVATAVKRELVDETGLHAHDVADAMTKHRSSPGDLTYSISRYRAAIIR